MPALDQIYLRAAVSAACNLNCEYCPKASGMENRVPEHLRGATLSTDDYIKVLAKLAAAGIKRVSFTGGEPTLNPDLPRIVESAADHFEVVELTSNGLHLAKMMKELSSHLNLLKVSLDTTNPKKFAAITKSGTANYHRAVDAIELALSLDVPVGINCVFMRSNAEEVDQLIQLARDFNDRHSTKAYLSVLDFYYSAEKRDSWEKEFVQIRELENSLRSRYVTHETEDRFGCRFVWVDADGVEVRLKDSAGPTMRAAVCNQCAHYCQEGIYGLKLSTVGWVTTCPVSDRKLGVQITPDMPMAQIQHVLAEQVNRIVTSSADSSSFEKMLVTHGLQAR